MALTVGELVATFSVDPSEGIRGLDTAELRMRGFQRDAEGHLRRVDGSLVDTATAARELGTTVMRGMTTAQLATAGYTRDASGQLRDVRGRYVAAGDAAERMGHQMLEAGVEGAAGARMLGAETERHLGERGVTGRSRLATTALGGLRAGLSGVGSGAVGLVGKLGPMIAQLGSAVPVVAGLVGTLESIAPAGMVAAAGIVTAVTAVATLKLATHGIGDAVKTAFDPGTKPAELKEALSGLAPPARQFVLALRSLRPELKGLQQDVQGEVFAGLGAQIKTLASTLLPTLQVQLGNSAMVFNMMASQAIDTATRLSKGGVFGTALDSATRSLYDLQGVPSLVVQALGQMAAAAGPTLNKLTAGVSGAVDSLSQKLNTAFSSGGMTRAIDTAVGVLKQLGSVLGNVGSIIGSVFAAAGAAGGSWLGILADITGALRVAFASPEVQAGLSALFGAMATLGQTLAPLVAMALSEIAPILVALLPPFQLVVKSLGDGLRPVIAALGPVLLSAAQAVGALATAFAPLWSIVGSLIAQLLPILTPVLDLLTSVFLDLAGPIRQVAGVLGKALQPVIKGLTLVIQDLVDQYLDIFLNLLGQLLPLIPQLVPVVLQLGQSIGQILAAVAPLLPQLASMAVMFALQLLPAILPLLPPLLQLTTILLELATATITKVVVPALQFLIDFMAGLQKKFQPAIDAVRWLTTGISSLFEWLADHLVGHSVIPDMVRSIVSWFAGLPGKAIAALGNIAARLGSVIAQAATAMVGQAKYGVQLAAYWISTLPGKAVSALGNIGGLLYKSGQALLRGFIDGIKSMGSLVKSAVSSVLGGARDLFPFSPAKTGPFAGRGWVRYSGESIGEALAAGMTSRQAHVARAAATLLGGAHGALGGNLGGVGLGGGLALAGAGGTVSGGTQQVVVKFDVSGADEDMKRLIRRMVKGNGNGGPDSVQRTFG